MFACILLGKKRGVLHHHNLRTLDVALQLQLRSHLVQEDQVFVRGKHCHLLSEICVVIQLSEISAGICLRLVPNGCYSCDVRSSRSRKQELELQPVSEIRNNGNQDSIPVADKDE